MQISKACWVICQLSKRLYAENIMRRFWLTSAFWYWSLSRINFNKFIYSHKLILLIYHHSLNDIDHAIHNVNNSDIMWQSTVVPDFCIFIYLQSLSPSLFLYYEEWIVCCLIFAMFVLHQTNWKEKLCI